MYTETDYHKTKLKEGGSGNMSEQQQHTYVCDKCGNEAELTFKEESDNSEHKHEYDTQRKTLVCKICGNEADMTFEEI